MIIESNHFYCRHLLHVRNRTTNLLMYIFSTFSIAFFITVLSVLKRQCRRSVVITPNAERQFVIMLYFIWPVHALPVGTIPVSKKADMDRKLRNRLACPHTFFQSRSASGDDVISVVAAVLIVDSCIYARGTKRFRRASRNDNEKSAFSDSVDGLGYKFGTGKYYEGGPF